MFKYSLCMIVKNEEKVLARCLDSFATLFDEVVIVDTGSTDKTKEIAGRYTDKIYDFPWEDDFAAARNFAFSKCTGDYIYSCDADEVLDAENRKRLLLLMGAMMDEVEIVQMIYVDPRSTVLNDEKELRPKLFKRQRRFCWIDPVHETVRLEPVVFDSDIEIFHMPEGDHAGRDFSIFRKAFDEEKILSKNYFYMYAVELFKCGSDEDFAAARPVFELRHSVEDLDPEAFLAAQSVLCRIYRLAGEETAFFKMAMRAFYPKQMQYIVGCSEICCELGHYFKSKGDKKEAALWYRRAMEEAMPVVDERASDEIPQQGLKECALS